MSDPVWTLLLWPATVVVVAVLLLAWFGRPAAAWLQAASDARAATARLAAVQAGELVAAVALDEATAAARADHRAAELAMEAANLRAQAEVEARTVDDRAAAARELIAERARLEMQLLPERVRANTGDAAAMLASLTKAYEVYSGHVSSAEVFRDWAPPWATGPTAPGQPATAEAVAAAYAAKDVDE